ncbi:hypothetical protein VTO42DRAFT_8020 [Malbranchea cinnamomea]
MSQYAIYPSLKDRVVVISGGATGIGASMAEAFALQGAQVVILDILSSEADALADRLTSMTTVLGDPVHRPIHHHCDVTDIDGAIRPVAAKILAQFPRVHVLINNAASAGSAARRPALEVTAAQWDQDLAVNLRHVFFLTQALMPGLRAAGAVASVINMGSITWAIPSTDLIPYAASKAAIMGLTRTLAHEFGPSSGLRVNSIMPGAIATEKQKREVQTPEYVEYVLKQQALKRILHPEEVARMALWLAADDSSGVTNQSFVIDAGWI